jgi:hypothetical protein
MPAISCAASRSRCPIQRIGWSNDRPEYRMCVKAAMTDGARIELIKGLEDPGQAFYLGNLLERRLGIESRPVHGEFKGSQVN